MSDDLGPVLPDPDPLPEPNFRLLDDLLAQAEALTMPAAPEPDELRGVPGAALREGLWEAAVLRDARRPWEEVARAVGRSVSTVTKWPGRYPARWQHYLREAARRRRELFDALVQRVETALLEGGLEAVVVLRSLMRGKLVEARDGTRGDLDTKGELAVAASVREAAAHSLVAAAMKLVGERHVVEVHEAAGDAYGEMDDEELIQRAYPGLRAVE